MGLDCGEEGGTMRKSLVILEDVRLLFQVHG